VRETYTSGFRHASFDTPRLSRLQIVELAWLHRMEAIATLVAFIHFLDSVAPQSGLQRSTYERRTTRPQGIHDVVDVDKECFVNRHLNGLG